MPLIYFKGYYLCKRGYVEQINHIFSLGLLCWCVKFYWNTFLHPVDKPERIMFTFLIQIWNLWHMILSLLRSRLAVKQTISRLPSWREHGAFISDFPWRPTWCRCATCGGGSSTWSRQVTHKWTGWRSLCKLLCLHHIISLVSVLCTLSACRGTASCVSFLDV